MHQTARRMHGDAPASQSLQKAHFCNTLGASSLKDVTVTHGVNLEFFDAKQANGGKCQRHTGQGPQIISTYSNQSRALDSSANKQS